MGGQVALRAMVVSSEIKAGVIWAGVIAPLDEIISRWDPAGHRQTDRDNDLYSDDLSERTELNSTVQEWVRSFGSWVEKFIAMYGTADQNPAFWDTVSPNSYVADLSGPIQIHHGSNDKMVPLEWSEDFVQDMQDAGMPIEMYTYENDDHNISINFREAMQRTVAFFDAYLK